MAVGSRLANNRHRHMQHQQPQVRVWFDSQCPLCRKEIAFMRRLDWRHRVDFIDLDTAQDCLSNPPYCSRAFTRRNWAGPWSMARQPSPYYGGICPYSGHWENWLEYPRCWHCWNAPILSFCACDQDCRSFWHPRCDALCKKSVKSPHHKYLVLLKRGET